MLHSGIVVVTFAVLLFGGCRREEILPDEPGTPGPAPTQYLSFAWTGSPSPFRYYTQVRARYEPISDLTTVETFGDSVPAGKFFMQLHGGRVGRFVYRVTGSPSDTNQMYIRFVSGYNGTMPTSQFELTGLPSDSLEAEAVVSYIGAAGDSIAGTMSARLKVVGSSREKIVLYAGEFTVQRRE